MLLREKAKRLIAETKKGLKPDLDSLYLSMSKKQSTLNCNNISLNFVASNDMKNEVKEKLPESSISCLSPSGKKQHFFL